MALSLSAAYLKGRAVATTRENLADAERALKAFLEFNGAYPCPAPLSAPRGTPGFGRAVSSCITDTKGVPVSQDDKTGTLTAAGRDRQNVRIGFLPFRSLGIPDAKSVDGWGRLLQYAVTEKMTLPDRFNQMDGAIDVVAEDRGSRLTPPGTAQYVVFSTGADGIGGYSADGVAHAPCRADLAEGENCNGDAVFMDTLPLYKQSGGKNGQTDVDDYIAYQQYDPYLNTRRGLVFIYRGSCMPGFHEIDTQGRRVAGIETLSKTAPGVNGEMDLSGDEKVCFSPRYSIAMTLLTSSFMGKAARCPDGWAEIGYQAETGSDNSGFMEGGGTNMRFNYQVCAH